MTDIINDFGRRVYYAKKGGLIKIGVSYYPWHRTKSLQCELLGVEPAVEHLEAFKFERLAHQRWAHLQVRGEWFTAAPSLMEYIATLDCPPRPNYMRKKVAS